jgi:hypothetical protein
MGFASYDELQAAVQRIVLRTGDAVFAADFPRQVQFAEQRINFGCQAPLASPALRIRGMTKTVKLPVVDGVATVPADFLEAKRLTWDSDIAFPLHYRTPEEFWNYRLYGSGLPVSFTVEGFTLTLAPAVTGEATLTYFAKFEAVQTEDTLTDETGSAILTEASETITLPTTQASNWLMENAPAVVMNAVLIESWKFLRNNERAQEAFAEYVSAAGGLNLTETKARTSMSTLAPRIRGATIPCR